MSPMWFCIDCVQQALSLAKETLQWVEKVCAQSIPSEALVCRACEKFIKRNTGKTNIITRWILKDSRSQARIVIPRIPRPS